MCGSALAVLVAFFASAKSAMRRCLSSVPPGAGHCLKLQRCFLGAGALHTAANHQIRKVIRALYHHGEVLETGRDRSCLELRLQDARCCCIGADAVADEDVAEVHWLVLRDSSPSNGSNRANDPVQGGRQGSSRLVA